MACPPHLVGKGEKNPRVIRSQGVTGVRADDVAWWWLLTPRLCGAHSRRWAGCGLSARNPAAGFRGASGKRKGLAGHSAKPLFQLVEPTGIEPVTSTMPFTCAPVKPRAFSRYFVAYQRILSPRNAGFSRNGVN